MQHHPLGSSAHGPHQNCVPGTRNAQATAGLLGVSRCGVLLEMLLSTHFVIVPSVEFAFFIAATP